MARNAFRIVLGLAAPLVLSVGLAGCGPRMVDVSGHVRYNGAPLARQGGEIVFVGPGGKQVPATVGTDGSYQAVGVPVGLNRVAVYYRNPAAQVGKRERLASKGAAAEATGEPASPYLTPIKYAAVETSELEVQVAPGAVFDAELTGPELP